MVITSYRPIHPYDFPFSLVISTAFIWPSWLESASFVAGKFLYGNDVITVYPRVNLTNEWDNSILWTRIVPDGGKFIAGFMSAVTGWPMSQDDLLKIGERLANIRHAFNLREGINPLKWKVHPRIIGSPPHKAGPLAGVTADMDAQIYWNLGALDWDRVTTKPSKAKLLALGGLEDITKELWP